MQGLVLCTPHSQHTDQIVAAAASGKHVFCEKPLSMTRSGVLRAIEAVDRAGVIAGLRGEAADVMAGLVAERGKNLST